MLQSAFQQKINRQKNKSFQTSDLDVLGLKLVSARIFTDERGYFLESFRQKDYRELGLGAFVQDNHVFSYKKALRGMHFQPGQAKLVTAVSGEIFDVAVDIRKDSKTFGQWRSAILSEKNCLQFFIPDGFAHGYLVLSETAHVLYKVSAYHNPAKEKGFSYKDAEIGIKWPLPGPFLLSEKDEKAKNFKQVVSC